MAFRPCIFLKVSISLKNFWQVLVVLGMCVTMVSGLTGCRKSNSKKPEEVAIQEHELQLKREHAMQELMKTPEFSRTSKCMEFLKALKSNGELPGVSKDEHGTIRVEKAAVTNGEEPHLVSQELHFITMGSPAKNFYYVVTQTASNSDLHLQKAWQTDKSGHLIEEYPLQ